MKNNQNNLNDFTIGAYEELKAIVARLRDPNGGCPWDLEQTHETLRQYLIEETYEVVDAIDHTPDKLKEELGDVVLQIFLHSQIAAEDSRFTMDDVLRAVSAKMVKRHPHVFGDKDVKNSKEVLKNWEQIKKADLAEGVSLLDGVPRGMPALLRAQRVGEKAARVGFEWNTTEEVRDKVIEEIKEFLAECLAPEVSKEKLKDEFGDVLFALCQLARRMDVTSEDLLQKATDKFTRRFKEMERRVGDVKAKTVQELDQVWEEVKAEEKK